MEETIFKVPVTTIRDIIPHGNADSLEVAIVYNFHVVVKKGQYQKNHKVVYIPVDSILSPDLEAKLFPADAKIKLTKSRVRQIRIRKYPSQGMLVSIDTCKELGLTDFDLEKDLKADLNVKKYEPPVVETNQSARVGMSRDKTYNHPLFHSYNGLNNIKWFVGFFGENEEVVVQEKLHGSNMRIACIPSEPVTLIQKIKRFFGLLPKYEFDYGSNNVQISRKSGYAGYYDKDVYGEVVERLNLFDKLQPNEIVYGELIGTNIQKNYHYGHTKQNHFVVFDVKKYNEEKKEFVWLLPEETEEYCKERGFDHVPVLYRGPYISEIIANYVNGPSVYYPEHKVREGIVIKSRYGYNDPTSHSGRKSLKWISELYLDDHTNTDNK